MTLLLATSLLGLLTEATALPTSQNSLQWTPCEDQIDLGDSALAVRVPIDCARLDVPLDYTNPDSEPLTLQLVKANATKMPSLGSVLFNPGGPGISGVEDLAFTGPIYNAVLGGQYDLIGFDPRGTGKTVPFNCDLWNTTYNFTDTVLARRDILPERSMTEELLGRGWAGSTYIAEQCYKAQNETGSFLTTAFVARDMLQIVDALDEDGMLRYWGLSYGTVLGSTFAAMFPDRIDRMFLDSVPNPTDYMSGLELTTALDSDNALLGYFEECIFSGPLDCPIANFSGPSTTPEDLLAATYTMFQDLLDNPRHLPENASTRAWNRLPPITLYEDLKVQLFSTLYAPRAWPLVARSLEELLRLNFTEYLRQTTSNTNYLRYNEGVDAFWGISCSDAAYRADSPQDAFDLVRAQQNVSSFADVVLPQIWPCYQWKMEAAERYEGDFKARTSYPILIVNGLYDPITPFESAVNVSKGFEGSVLLTHGGHGHGFYFHPSLCTARAIRAYFVNGTLPAPNTYCKPDQPAFEIDVTALYDGSAFNETGLVKREEFESEDAELQWAMRRLAQLDVERGRWSNLLI